MASGDASKRRAAGAAAGDSQYDDLAARDTAARDTSTPPASVDDPPPSTAAAVAAAAAGAAAAAVAAAVHPAAALPAAALPRRRFRRRRFRSLGVPHGVYSPALVDSGTTFFFVPTPAYEAIHQRLRRACPTLRKLSSHHICAHLTPAERDRLPAMELVLQGVGGPQPTTSLLVSPRQYMVRYPSPLPPRARRRSERRGERHYCAEIFNNGPGGGTVLGASVLRDREMIFDLESSTISFVDSDCGSLRAGTAQMQGSWAFAPCPAADRARGGARQDARGRPLLDSSKELHPVSRAAAGAVEGPGARGGANATTLAGASSRSALGALFRWPWGRTPWA